MVTSEYKNIYDYQQTLWWYRGMAEILSRLLFEYLPYNNKRKILDAGCGTGAAFSFLKPLGTVIGVDVSPEALRFAKKVGEKTRKASVMKMPFPAASFDVVVSLDVLYHMWVSDHRKALAEYVRVLKSGGILLWREPAYEWLKSGHDLVDFTKRRFTNDQMINSFLGMPVEIKKTTYVNIILFPLVIIKRLPSILHLEKINAKSDIGSVQPLLNKILTLLFSFESHFVPFLSFPFGSSVICIVQKK